MATFSFDPGLGTPSQTFESSYTIALGATYASVVGETFPTATLEGYTFDGWKDATADVTLTAENWATETFTGEDSDTLVFTAQYTELPSYTITVTDGTSSADSAKEGAEITLTADEAPEGKKFSKWADVTPSTLEFDKSKSPVTFTMPASDVTATATYAVDDVNSTALVKPIKIYASPIAKVSMGVIVGAVRIKNPLSEDEFTAIQYKMPGTDMWVDAFVKTIDLPQ